MRKFLVKASLGTIDQVIREVEVPDWVFEEDMDEKSVFIAAQEYLYDWLLDHMLHWDFEEVK